MGLRHLPLCSLFVGAALANPHLHRRQDGPVDPGTAADCTWYDTALDASYTCEWFEFNWGLSHEDFVSYNPSVLDDCSGIKIGNSYCVEVNNGQPRPTITSPTPTGTATPKPSPTQDGLIDTCNSFYRAVSGDTCDKIVARYGTFTLSQFLGWNPAVGSDCSGLVATYYYCVGVPGLGGSSTTTTATSTSTSTRTSTTASGPTPTQTGIISACTRYHKAVDGDSCTGIVQQYGTFTLDQFLAWNSAVGADCAGLWLGYYYCIGVPGTATKTSTSTTMTTTTTAGCASAPTPTQPGAVCACKSWHKVVSGNTCDAIQKQYGITAANFNKWNPQVGTDCKSLWLGYYVCVGA
ncbi:hypothetical protein BJX76DRAFT_29083 [Aspergillus varians]